MPGAQFSLFRRVDAGVRALGVLEDRDARSVRERRRFGRAAGARPGVSEETRTGQHRLPGRLPVRGRAGGGRFPRPAGRRQIPGRYRKG
ncbi:hypothetical protein GCM10022207_62940 [Streptomyces lannensis]|uniref:Uncharacterized protein n=1 Tax=Streptomyces lannensis TaxID=766498 RepID=A0ABP7KSR6_9ACTN